MKGDWGALFGLDSSKYRVKRWFKKNHRELSKKELACTPRQLELVRHLELIRHISSIDPNLQTLKLVVTSRRTCSSLSFFYVGSFLEVLGVSFLTLFFIIFGFPPSFMLLLF